MHDFKNDHQLAQLRVRLNTEDELMKKGIQTDPDTGRQYFTGYDYHTLYDWDQYFETIVQVYMGWSHEYARNGVTIFLDHQQPSGHICRTVPRCDFHDHEHVKPFLAQITLLVMDHYGEKDWFTAEYYEKMKKYLNYWLDDLDRTKSGLSEWNSAPHTGMDNQHERAGWWFDKISKGVDLNCYLVREMRAFARLATGLGRAEDAAHFLQRAEQRAALIQKLCWNEEDGFYYDINARTGEQIQVKSISGFTPLWAGIANPGQAHRLVTEHLMNAAEFWTPWPIATLAKTEPGYSQVNLPHDLGCNWRATTWIPTNYMVYHGLRDYGYTQCASLVAHATARLMKNAGNREYYNSETGGGNGLDPFWGWSILGHFFLYEESCPADITKF